MTKKRTAGRLMLLVMLAAFFREGYKLEDFEKGIFGEGKGFGKGGAGAR